MFPKNVFQHQEQGAQLINDKNKLFDIINTLIKQSISTNIIRFENVLFSNIFQNNIAFHAYKNLSKKEKPHTVVVKADISCENNIAKIPHASRHSPRYILSLLRISVVGIGQGARGKDSRTPRADAHEFCKSNSSRSAELFMPEEVTKNVISLSIVSPLSCAHASTQRSPYRRFLPLTIRRMNGKHAAATSRAAGLSLRNVGFLNTQRMTNSRYLTRRSCYQEGGRCALQSGLVLLGLREEECCRERENVMRCYGYFISQHFRYNGRR